MKRLVTALLFASTLVTVSSAADTVQIAPSGETKIHAQSGKRTVDVAIKTELRKVAVYPDETSSTAPDRSVINSIAITINGRPVLVPGSVTCWLVSPVEAAIRVGSVTSVLTITGGDTSAAYVAHIEFDSRQVRRRTVASGMMPNEPTEITTYHLRTLKSQ